MLPLQQPTTGHFDIPGRSQTVGEQGHPKLAGEHQDLLCVKQILARRHDHLPEKTLKRLMGRLNHTAFIVPLSRHFTAGRLYQALGRAQKVGKVLLDENQLLDLCLWLRNAGTRGISINRLICRWPTQMIRINACPQGIRGYCLSSGIAWRFLLPEELLGRASLDALEFLAVRKGRDHPRTSGDIGGHHAGDSTSAPRWVKKSSINDACPNLLAIARSFTTLLCMEKKINHYTQRFPGNKNIVANALSRDFGLPDKNFKQLLQLANPPSCRRTSGSFSCMKPPSHTLESCCGSVDCDIVTGIG